jgi:hypothetical protein
MLINEAIATLSAEDHEVRSPTKTSLTIELRTGFARFILIWTDCFGPTVKSTGKLE